MTYEQACALMRIAPLRLQRHNALVMEALDGILGALWGFGDQAVDEEVMRIGVIFHDSGKIFFPEEFDSDGDRHEQAGFDWCIEIGLHREVALCCTTYSRWSIDPRGVFHVEMTVALADKLWKGSRDALFEEDYVRRIARLYGKDHWQVSVALDRAFEEIAADGPSRLERSRL